MANLDPKIVAAIIAAITSIVILVVSFIFKSLYQRHFHTFKLEQEYRYEQRKKLKEILSRNKIQLLNSCESLDFRLWNFTTHYKDNWHEVGGKYTTGGYYFKSFVYRFVRVFSWIRKIEDEMVYLDTTIATRSDMEFLKYLRLFPQLLCDLSLFEGFDYDPNYQKDHIFTNNFERMSQCMIKENSIYTYPQFEEEFGVLKEDLFHACKFIDGLSPDEDRLRWDRLQVLHIALTAFLNSFGYDFQKASDEKIEELINQPRKSRLIANFVQLIKRNKLDKQKEFKKVIKVITH